MKVNDVKYLTPENDNFGRKLTSSFTDTCDWVKIHSCKNTLAKIGYSEHM